MDRDLRKRGNSKVYFMELFVRTFLRSGLGLVYAVSQIEFNCPADNYAPDRRDNSV